MFAPLAKIGKKQGASAVPTRAVRRLQAKLAVGHVNDPLEHEADRAADQVMRMSPSDFTIASAAPQLSRNCADCEAEEQSEVLQRKLATTPEPAADLLGAVDQALHSTGRPLDNGTRAYFEPRFGHSFSRVQVHSGSAVHDDAAAAANAKAFTVGSHLVFAAHEYAPHTRSGKGLIAHELAHVVQQAGGALPSVQRQVYKPDDLKPRHRDPPKPAKRKKVHRPKPFDPLRGCKAEDLRTPEAGSCIAKNSGSPADISFFVRCLPSGEKECCELRDDPTDPITICEDLSEHTEPSPHRRKGRGKRSGS